MKNLMIVMLVLIAGCARHNGKDGANGLAGRDGIDGTSGLNGTNGHNAVASIVTSAAGCSNGGSTLLVGTDLNDNLILDLAEVTASTEVCNGSNGTNAPPTPYTPTGIVDPCNDTPNKYDEVFIRLQNGTLLASFSDNANGQNTRFSVLVAGNYITTDGTGCYFSVDSSGNLFNEHF